MRKDLLKGLTEEQIAKARTCKNAEELLALARKDNVELSDEQLEAITGGAGCSTPSCGWCPKCHSTNIRKEKKDIFGAACSCKCRDCGHQWDM